jgi:arabinogalactan oligomer / maltooligosaccharide transport system permease protein
MKRLESIAAHLIVGLAVAFAIYPLLWVISVALSPDAMSDHARALPLPDHPSLGSFATVLGLRDGRAGLFARQVVNSLSVSLLTAAVAVGVATPAAYALARFRFVGKTWGMRALLATQMFPAVASAVPLYLLLEALHLLD